MGADFLLYSAPIPTRDGHPDLSDEAKVAVLAAIDAWTPTDDNTYDLEEMVRVSNLEDDFDFTNPLELTAATLQLRDKLRSAFTQVWDYNREVDTFEGHWVSGGMSWGDPPTDACELIDLLAMSGVTEIELAPAPVAKADANSGAT